MIGYNTKTFKAIWATSDDFVTDLTASAFTGCIENPTLVYYLLYSRFANSHIVGKDEDQWKIRMFTRLYSCGPTYEKKMAIQKSLREMTDEDLLTNGQMISKMGYNPSTVVEDGGVNAVSDISTVDQQNSTKTVSGKLNAYANLWLALKTDITSAFINDFKDLFISVILPGAINEAIIPIPESELNAINAELKSINSTLEDKVDKSSINSVDDDTTLEIDTYNN